MYKVKSKAKNGVMWDAKANKPLAAFKNGIFETEDKKVVDALKAKGCAVEEVEVSLGE